MTLAPGRMLLHYRITDKIGEGGMGAVWEAVDTTLDRRVAIKMLPARFATDNERLARFEREAKLLASLNHPNIAGIYGLHGIASTEPGQTDVRFLAMELVQGEDLAQRLARGPLAIDEALAVAMQVARALEAAHAQGIVHRDLKPANIVRAADGTIKVLDFGLAKALAADPASGEADPALSPTMTSAGTQAGMILGTAAYMSPEQARGRAADGRADLWAFGVTLMEMLTGRQLFTGETVSDILAEVLKSEPDWSALPADTPQPVRRLLRRCLRRDPDKRLHHPADARLEIEAAQSDPDPVELGGARGATAAAAPAPGPTWRRVLPWVLATIALAAVVTLAVREANRPTAPEPVLVRFDIQIDGLSAGAPGVSPDGRRFAYVGRHEDRSALFVRAFDEADGHPLEGVVPNGAASWSPDSASLAFFTEKTLERIRLDSGTAQTVCRVPQGWRDVTWSRNDVMLIEVSAAGDEGWYVCRPGSQDAEPYARPLPLESGQTRAHPRFMPDGERFIFVHHVDGVRQAVLAKLGSNEATLLFPTDSKVEPAGNGWYFYSRQGQLLARAFDPSTYLPVGEPVKVADRVDMFEPNGRASFWVSDQGTVTYFTGEVLREEIWYNRDGNELGPALDPGEYLESALSPDGRMLLLGIKDPRTGTSDLWVHDLERGIADRLTNTGWAEFSPVWSPDGRRIVYSADPQGPPNLYMIGLDGGDPVELVPPSGRVHYPSDWSRDGTTVFFSKSDAATAWDIWTLPVTEAGAASEPQVIVNGESSERLAALSPDGRWLAYTSSETGTSEVYVQPYGHAGLRQRVSTDIGFAPRWAGNDRLFFASREETLLAVTLRRDGDRLAIGKPEIVLDLGDENMTDYGLHPDGRILVTRLADVAAADRVKVVSGWH